MSRTPVYNHPEIVKRLKKAYDATKNATKLCIKLRQDSIFRSSHGLDQHSVDEIFIGTGSKAPQIAQISIVTLKKSLACVDAVPSTNGDVHITPMLPSVQNPVLRQHQNEALVKVFDAVNHGVKIGKIILPTGTGKTRIEAEIICGLNEEYSNGIYVLLAPRIILTYQLLKEVGQIVTKNGMQAAFLNVNSGAFPSDRLEKILLKLGIEHPEKVDTTTTIENIKIKMSQAQKSGRPLLIFSTYHSADRVRDAAQACNTKITAYLYDEAQYCVSNGEFQNTPLFPARHKFFFTATEKNTADDKGLGMNNETKFGATLFVENPKTLIEQGEMASVAIHLVGARENIGDKNHESKARIVFEAFDKHREVVRQYAANPDAIGPKMLVVCDSQETLKGMIKSAEREKYKNAHQHVKIYALSSDYGIDIEGYEHQEVSNKGKEQLFASLQDLENTDEAVIFHVDMLSEGMDVPGITGVLPFRNLSKIKLLQNVGRGTRLVDIDRAGLYAKTITPKDFGKDVKGEHIKGAYTKPYCWVILPVLSALSYDFKHRAENYIYGLRSDYDFKSGELVVVDNIIGPPEDKPVENMSGGIARKFVTGKDMITEVIHEIEESEAMTQFMDHAFDFKKLRR